MATLTVDARFQQRSDTSSNWSSRNPILLVGEIGMETGSGKIKVGNGLSTWNALAYIGITSEYIDANYVRKSGQAMSSNYTYRLCQTDTRDDVELPEYYMLRGLGRVIEFKRNFVIGIPVVIPAYSQVCTIVPWQDASGGYPVQIGVSTGGIYKRNANNETEWSAWVKVSESEITT